MTKLPDEIEAHIHHFLWDFFLGCGDWTIDNKKAYELLISHLGKYLTIPTDEGIEKHSRIPITDKEWMQLWECVGYMYGMYKDDSAKQACDIHREVNARWIENNKLLLDKPKEVEGIEKEEPMCTHMDWWPYCHDCAREARIECEKKSNEVKPPTKDTIEKIEPRQSDIEYWKLEWYRYWWEQAIKTLKDHTL